MLPRLASLAFAVVIVLLAPGSPKVLAAPGPSIATLRAQGASEVKDVYVRMPQNVPDGQPIQVLIALHGMGGNGNDFGQAMAAQADARGWAIVAPTFTYGDWTDPNQISREDPALVAWLSDYVRHLGDKVGVPVMQRVLLFGHSRGAQLALRFTEIHPELVTAVAAVSAGTYTLPFSRDHQGQMLKFPFGVGDLATLDGGQAFDQRSFESVPVWIGVGGADDRVGDVPSAWDPYIGDDRLERANTFAQALKDMGAEVNLAVFPNADHTLTDDMRAAGCSALASADG
jgi:pimeloyl-ACP methyl ester carboxylesterase